MRSVKNCVEVILLLIVIGAATFSQRFVIFNWLSEHARPPLPEAIEYRELASATLPQSASSDLSETSLDLEPTQPSPDLEPTQASPDSEPKQTAPTLEPAHALDEDGIASEAAASNTQPEEAAPLASLPSAFNLAVPFTPQAPEGNWDLPYQEACEEASLYMAHAFYQGVGGGTINPLVADAELKRIVDFEMQLFGKFEDTTVAQTASLAEKMYGYGHTEVLEDPTVAQIKAHVAAGRPVLVPAAGRELHNPHFTAPGPIYHMLVVRGYTADGRFITNDPGTKYGEAFTYDFDTLMQAMHDWNNGEEITEGKKAVLVLYP